MYNVKFAEGYPARLQKQGDDITIYYNDKNSLIHELVHLYKGVTLNKAFLGLSFQLDGRYSWYKVVMAANVILDYYIYKQTEGVTEWRKLAKKVLKGKAEKVEYVIKHISAKDVTTALQEGLKAYGYKNLSVNKTVVTTKGGDNER